MLPALLLIGTCRRSHWQSLPSCCLSSDYYFGARQFAEFVLPAMRAVGSCRVHPIGQQICFVRDRKSTRLNSSHQI